MTTETGRWSRRGATVVELVVALPILAVGLAAASSLIHLSSVHLAGGEVRLQAAIHGVAIMDSLRTVDHPMPVGGTVDEADRDDHGWDTTPAIEGQLEVAGARVGWRWDGCCLLAMRLHRGASTGDQALRGPEWTLSPFGTDAVWVGEGLGYQPNGEAAP